MNGIKALLNYLGLSGRNSNPFQCIPCQRVVNENVRAEELFDLYQLGTFHAPDSFLVTLSGSHDQQVVYENVELVVLQPQSRYRPHYHRHSAAVIYIVSGKGTFRLCNTDEEYYPGKRILIPAGLLHGFNTDTLTLFLSIQSPPILNRESGSVDLYYENEVKHEPTCDR
ncbi:cupin domain-containing protein [Aquicella lusitana]|uniref:Cupin domain n=1 Tax=Aquicella lusitana TaxID=254246 RepID=A0A370GE70_9COXI|nr:cupin domain-containing protein [Aquicella lusitana]RDI42085.1 cupin domain [Aquicella lusitana]VVC74408.1 hypothetical protein AQULUS_21740 [Aquicella lusitana]